MDQAPTPHSPDDFNILKQSKKCSKLAESLVSKLNTLRIDERNFCRRLQEAFEPCDEENP